MKTLIFSIALFIASYNSSNSQDYFKDTLWMHKTDQSDGFYMLKFSQNDSIIAGFGYQNTVFFNSQTGEESSRINGNGYGMFMNNDNNFIRISPDNKTIEILETKTWKVVNTLENDSSTIGNFDINKDENTLIAVVSNGIRKWDLQTKKIIKTSFFAKEFTSNQIYPYLKNIEAWNLSIDNKSDKVYLSIIKTYVEAEIVKGLHKESEKKYIEIFDYKSLDSFDIFTNAIGVGYTLSKSNPQKIAIFNTSIIEIQDLNSKQLIQKIPSSPNLTGLEFSADDKYLVTSSTASDDKMIFWEVQTGKILEQRNEASYTNFKISNNNKFIIWSIGNDLILDKSPFGITSVDLPLNILPTLFPNPSNGIVNIRLQFQAMESYNVKITDLTGSTVLSIPNIAPQNNIITLNVSQLHTGTYNLTLSANNFTQTYKLIKE